MRILPSFLVALEFVAHNSSAGTPVTFNKDVGPIIYRNCSSCHRPGEAAPFALLSYQDAVKKGKMIAKVTSSGLMPPWKAEPASYAYRGERRLTMPQRELIQTWVKEGMPEGNAADKPEPRSSLQAGSLANLTWLWKCLRPTMCRPTVRISIATSRFLLG